MPIKYMSTKNFLISLVIIITGIIGYYSYRNLLKTKNLFNTEQFVDAAKNPNTSLNTKTIYELPQGEHVYNASHGQNTSGPKMSQIIFSPLSFEKGDTQKIKIIFPETEGVGSVIIFVTTDTKDSQKITFTKDSKINTWYGEWITNDSVKTRYSVKIVAVGSSGEYNNTMYFL